MNKNSLRQLIVTEMILADVNGGGHAPPKKRSLLEMMDDSYLSELEDGRLAHSMKIMLEIGADDWDNYSQHSADGRAPAAKPKPQLSAITHQTKPNEIEDTPTVPEAGPDSAEAQAKKLPAIKSQPAQAEIVDDSATRAKIDDAVKQRRLEDATEVEYEFQEDPKNLITLSNIKGGDDDSQGPGDEQADPDPNSASNGLAFLDAQVQSDLDTATANTEKSGITQSAANESHLSLIDLLYDA